MSWLDWLVNLLRPAPPKPPSPPPAPDDVSTRLLALHNQQRARNGLAPLNLWLVLDRAASLETQAICDTGEFSHTPGNSTFEERLHEAGYTSFAAAGENIAAGPATPEAAVSAWMGSAPHRANILGNYTEVGFSAQICGGVTYWSAAFGLPLRGAVRSVARRINLAGPLVGRAK